MAEARAITPRHEDYAQWYLDVIDAGDLTDDTPVRGCKVLKPNGFAIWEAIQRDLDRRFKETGHVNAYFPLLIPMSFLSKEAQHVDGFAKECALVTHHRLRAVTGADGVARVEPDPTARLEEPLVVRPTSETIIWHHYGRWIDSWRDLPLLLNQWANVMRWEMKTRPFLRTAEFLWQEGHTAHATREEAVEETLRMLDVYADFCREVLALPVIRGRKSDSERFAGAVDTYAVEAMMQNGWALQAGTSHFLGQNFAKAFDVTFQTATGTREHVWATSWGVSTRLIGATVMAHGDDAGLVLPPAVAPTQVVIVPIYKDDTRAEVVAGCDRIAASLKHRFRVRVDDRDSLRPGAKYFEWERKGVPLRLEVGPRDLAAGTVLARLRTDAQKHTLPLDGIVEAVAGLLDGLQSSLYAAAEARREVRTTVAVDRATFDAGLEAGHFVWVPWGGTAEDEEAIKEATRASLRVHPFDAPALPATCALTGRRAEAWAVFARAY
jgi:prolyl-tRNA synthetase